MIFFPSLLWFVVVFCFLSWGKSSSAPNEERFKWQTRQRTSKHTHTYTLDYCYCCCFFSFVVFSMKHRNTTQFLHTYFFFFFLLFVALRFVFRFFSSLLLSGSTQKITADKCRQIHTVKMFDFFFQLFCFYNLNLLFFLANFNILLANYKQAHTFSLCLYALTFSTHNPFLFLFSMYFSFLLVVRTIFFFRLRWMNEAHQKSWEENGKQRTAANEAIQANRKRRKSNSSTN